MIFQVKCFSCYNQPFFLKMTKKLRQKIKCLGEIKENFSTVGTPPPPPFVGGGRGWGLAGPQLLEGVCRKEGNEFFQGEGGWYPNAHYVFIIFKGFLVAKNNVIRPECVHLSIKTRARDIFKADSFGDTSLPFEKQHPLSHFLPQASLYSP